MDPPPARGEFVLVLEGAPIVEEQHESNAPQQTEYLLKAGLSTGQTREFLEKFAGLARNQAYRLVLDSQQKISAGPD